MRKKLSLAGILLSIMILAILFVFNVRRYGSDNGQTVVQATKNTAVSESSDGAESSKTVSATCINLYDEYAGDERLSKLYEEEDVFARLQSFNQKLNENTDYYEISFQALQSFEYFALDERFVKIYNQQGGKIENQLVDFEGKKRYVTSLNTIQVNKNFNDRFLASVGEGDVFAEEDFILHDLDRIPIIVGDNYRKYFHAGDSIRLNYLGTDFDFFIKGFLAPGVQLKRNDEIFCLDNFICVPNFQFYPAAPMLEDNKNFVFFMRYYLQNNSGYFQYGSSEEAEAIAEEIIKLAGQYDLDYLFIYNSFWLEIY